MAHAMKLALFLLFHSALENLGVAGYKSGFTATGCQADCFVTAICQPMSYSKSQSHSVWEGYLPSSNSVCWAWEGKSKAVWL